MIKWLLTGLEDACSNEAGVASKVWDYLELEMEESSPRPAAPMWEDAPSPSTAPAAMPVDDDLLWRNCMWGGRCGSHDHGAFSTRCDAVSKAPPRVPGAGESVLKPSAVLRAQPPPSPPPERELADSEKAMVFVSMTDVVCDVRWTACPAPAPPPSITALHVHEDHSYHLTRHSRTVHLDNLGVQTPSDSGTDDDFFEDEIMELPDLDADDVDFFGPESVFKDFAEPVDEELPAIKKSTSDTESGHHMSDSDEEEEIDVVSVLVEKARTLPTNPSVQDCHQLQQTVADAVGRSGRRLHHRRHHRHHRHRHHHRRRRDNQHPTKVKKYRMSEAADDLSASNKPGPCRGRPKKYRPVELVGDSEGSFNNPRPSKLKKLRLMESADDSDEDCNIKLKKHRTKEWKGVDSKGKRSLHNNMERQRRIDLSNQVWSLRKMVPAISDNHRAPRIVVLREAADYCRQLQVQATQLAAYKHELLRHNERLQNMHQLMLKKLQHQAGRRRGKKSSRRSRDSMC